MNVQRLSCCGVLEANGISLCNTPEQALYGIGLRIYGQDKVFAKRFWEYKKAVAAKQPTGERIGYPELGVNPCYGIVMFAENSASIAVPGPNGITDHYEPGAMHVYGSALRDYILERGLGFVVATEPVLNLNSHRNIRVFLWSVNHTAYRDWLGSNFPEVHWDGPRIELQPDPSLPAVSQPATSISQGYQGASNSLREAAQLGIDSSRSARSTTCSYQHPR